MSGTARDGARNEAPRDEVAAWLDGFLRQPHFLERYPCYAAILARLTPVADPSVKRMAVSLFQGRFFLHVNIDAFVREPAYLPGVLLHEVHHVALGHLTHPKFAEPDQPELMELALEMSANEFIEEPLPDPIRWQSYESVGIRAGQSTLERYDLLVRAARAGHEPTPVGTQLDDHRKLHAGTREPGGVEHTRKLLDEAERELRERGQGGKAQLVAGRTPGRLIEELSGELGPRESYLDWKSALRMFVSSVRAPVHTYARPNRRFPGRVGEVPGRTYVRRTITNPSLLVAIDTSMSMQRRELEEIVRQLDAMRQLARITVVECDTEITRVYAFTGRIESFAGRGGTDLRPVFARDFLGARPVDGIVYFTDGLGPTPDEPPPVPVLWVLTKPGDFVCPFGERARL